MFADIVKCLTVMLGCHSSEAAPRIKETMSTRRALRERRPPPESDPDPLRNLMG